MNDGSRDGEPSGVFEPGRAAAGHPPAAGQLVTDAETQARLFIQLQTLFRTTTWAPTLLGLGLLITGLREATKRPPSMIIGVGLLAGGVVLWTWLAVFEWLLRPGLVPVQGAVTIASGLVLAPAYLIKYGVQSAWGWAFGVCALGAVFVGVLTLRRRVVYRHLYQQVEDGRIPRSLVEALRPKTKPRAFRLSDG